MVFIFWLEFYLKVPPYSPCNFCLPKIYSYLESHWQDAWFPLFLLLQCPVSIEFLLTYQILVVSSEFCVSACPNNENKILSWHLVNSCFSQTSLLTKTFHLVCLASGSTNFGVQDTPYCQLSPLLYCFLLHAIQLALLTVPAIPVFVVCDIKNGQPSQMAIVFHIHWSSHSLA